VIQVNTNPASKYRHQDQGVLTRQARTKARAVNEEENKANLFFHSLLFHVYQGDWNSAKP